jgi:hypothetical protein
MMQKINIIFRANKQLVGLKTQNMYRKVFLPFFYIKPEQPSSLQFKLHQNVCLVEIIVRVGTVPIDKIMSEPQ